MITIALAGNPNSGKTTTFNEFTGARQHVANYPGITVDKKEAVIPFKGSQIRILDLPGTYSLTAYSEEERVVVQSLFQDNIDVVIDVINASSLERSLYLAVQFLELGVPLVLSLNMIDEVKKHGLSINSKKLSQLLGLPVIETVARTHENLNQLLEKAYILGSERQTETWKPLDLSYGPDLDPVLDEMTFWILQENSPLIQNHTPRWIALKYLENDERIMTLGQSTFPDLDHRLREKVDEVSRHLEQTLKTYPEAVIADYRYGFINGVLKQGVVTRQEDIEERLAVSDKADQLLTHRVLGPLFMFGILYAVYAVTFVIGDFPLQWLAAAFEWLGEQAENLLPDSMVKSLLISGVIDGVGGVVGFVPLIMIIFFLIALLEDSGYMARIAYMLDRIFRIFGLHGNSVMPYIISGGIAGGCAVPGVMATRTLRSPKEKLATILTLPFLTCGAKLPVLLLFSGIFFPNRSALVMFALTITGWVTALLVALLLRSTVIKGEPTPFVMELPPYRMPTLKGLLIHTWERTWMYVKKAGSIILAISILLWAAMTFPGLPEERIAAFDTRKAAIAEQYKDTSETASEALALIKAEESSERLKASLAGHLGVALESVSRAAGFDWKTNIALIGGFAAKEVIISTLGTAYSLGDIDPDEATSLAERIKSDSQWSVASALAFMVFVLLYAPCFVTVVMIRRETGSWRWALFGTVFNTLLAYCIAVAIFQVVSIL